MGPPRTLLHHRKLYGAVRINFSHRVVWWSGKVEKIGEDSQPTVRVGPWQTPDKDFNEIKSAITHPTLVRRPIIHSLCRVKLDFISFERALPERAASYQIANIISIFSSSFCFCFTFTSCSKIIIQTTQEGKGPSHSLSPQKKQSLPSPKLYLPLPSTSKPKEQAITSLNCSAATLSFHIIERVAFRQDQSIGTTPSKNLL
jgi:hypothetical protein